MRHEDCLVCTTPAFQRGDAEIVGIVAVAEHAGTDFHHHHVMRCKECGHQWFDDIVLKTGPHGAVRVLLIDRRDSEPCGCPEDDTDRYQSRALILKIAETDCQCTPADLERETSW